MKRLIIFTFISFSISISSQEKRVEKVYWDCAYNTLKDNGEFLKKQIKQYEKYLIKKEYLKDSTAGSYYKLFKSFPTRKSYPSVYDYSFFDSIRINTPETKKVFPSNKKCLEKIKDYNGYEMFLAKIHAADIVSDKDPKKWLEAYLEMLQVTDFNLDYYRIKTLLITQLLNFTID